MTPRLDTHALSRLFNHRFIDAPQPVRRPEFYDLLRRRAAERGATTRGHHTPDRSRAQTLAGRDQIVRPLRFVLKSA